MGTNYYCRRIKVINELESKKQIALNEAKDSVLLTEIVNEYFDSKINELYGNDIHIGKSSAGWDFLFQLNGKKHYHDKASMIDFIKECQIVSEYGVELTSDEFLNYIFSNRTWNGLPTKRHRNSAEWGYLYTIIDDLEFLDVEFS